MVIVSQFFVIDKKSLFVVSAPVGSNYKSENVFTLEPSDRIAHSPLPPGLNIHSNHCFLHFTLFLFSSPTFGTGWDGLIRIAPQGNINKSSFAFVNSAADLFGVAAGSIHRLPIRWLGYSVHLDSSYKWRSLIWRFYPFSMRTCLNICTGPGRFSRYVWEPFV